MHHLISAGAVLSVVVASPALAMDTPKDRYDMDTACFAITREAANVLDLNATDREHAATIRPLYAKRLAASSAAAGKTPADAAQAVAKLQSSSRAELHSPDAAKVRSELNDLHVMIQNCAALPVFELLGRGKAK